MESFILFHVKYINSCHFKPEDMYVELIDLPVEFFSSNGLADFMSTAVSLCRYSRGLNRAGLCSTSDSLGLEHMYVELRFLAVELAIIAFIRFQTFSYLRHTDAVSSGRRFSSATAVTASVRFLYPACHTENKCCFESLTNL